jgi:integrase/recombinase XerC
MPDPTITTYLAALQATRTEATVRLYSSVLRRAEKQLGQAVQWTVDGVLSFLSTGKVSNHSRNTYLAVLRSFCHAMLPTLDLSMIPSRVKYEQSPPRLATAAEVEQILEAGVLEDRARLALLLAADCGLREAEIRGLTNEDVDLEQGVLTVHGKGRKRRIVPITTKRCREALTSSLRSDIMSPLIRGKQGGQMSAGWLSKQIAAASEQVIRHRVSAHGFRHTFAVRSVEAGVQMKFIQQALGHQGIQTTDRYVSGLMVTAESIKEAYKGFE